MSFVHLHVHSQYSLLEATITVKGLVKRAKEFGMPAVALTDNGNMFGAIEFFFEAQEAGLRPILGLEVYLAPKGRKVKGEERDAARFPGRRLVLLAQSYRGYQSLCKISTIGYQEGFYYKPRIDDEVLSLYNEDLLALTGGLNGDVPWLYRNQGEEAALERIRFLKEIFPERLYLEMNRTGLAEWEGINRFLFEAGRITGVPLVAANDVYYLNRDDQVAQEVLICIGTNKTLHDETRSRLGTDQFYFKSPEQMRQLFQDHPEVCDRTLEIAERCQVQFRLKDAHGQPIYHLPSFPTAQGVSLKEEIAQLARARLTERFAELERRNEVVREEDKPRYFERLEYELKVIDGMGFNGYFLIVQDFIGWAKTNRIPVGPGRGSGAGSLVAYALGITDLNPMPYNLIFERFLNPERVSMPDFDVDFCQENRQRVIDYVTEKYGAASVSQIITYGKLQARAAIRDVGRVLGMTYGDVDQVAKLVPEKLGITLKEAIEQEPRLREAMETDPQVNTLMDLAQKIEGLVRHAGIHAAGVIIADGNIVSLAPLYRGQEGENVVQYDMKYAEKIGLIKFDFLGLKTLTHIAEALRLVEKNRGRRIETADISLSDRGIYEIMCRGDTAGIFQFEGEGITDLIRKAQPSCFEDIVAINALYRPGPMDMIPDYLSRKKGEVPVDSFFPELDDVLKETYGVIVYQEQVQLIAARIASYSLGEADMLRRAMGKKIPEVMAKQKDRFLAGAKQNQFDLEKAERLFDLMAEFAKYGFNKSHAAAYCVVAAQTAFLKNYYPVEFFAALLSTEMADTDKVVKYVKDAQKHGISVHPPHVNHSEYRFTVEGDAIFFSLGAIKGVGESAVEAIVEARNSLPEKKFSSLEEFFETVDLRRVNKKTVECLIRAGALDGFGPHRAQLMGGYGKLIDRAERTRKERQQGQSSLFDWMAEASGVESSDQVHLDECSYWSRSVTLNNEKEVLGFFLSDHPLNGLESLGRVWGAVSVSELTVLPAKSEVSLLGLITSWREIITKKGTRMAFAVFEDQSASVELIVFPDVFSEKELVLKSEVPLLLRGVLERNGEQEKLILGEAERLDVKLGDVKSVQLSLADLGQAKSYSLRDLHQAMKQFSGVVPVYLDVPIKDLHSRVRLKLCDPAGVRPDPEFFERAHLALGDQLDFQLEV